MMILPYRTQLQTASGFSFTCTDITQEIEWLFPAYNSLLAGATDGIIAINGGSVNTPITPSTAQALITSAEPTNGAYPFKRDGLVFYMGRASRNLYYFRYDLLSEQFISKDANLAAYDITNGGITKMRYQKDRNSLIFNLRGDNQLVTTAFQLDENINGWHMRTTEGLFKDLACMGDNLGNPQVFVLANRNGTFFIEQQSPYIQFKKRADFWTPGDTFEDQAQYEDEDTEAYVRYVSEQLSAANYLDNSLMYQDLRASTITFTPTGTDPQYDSPSGNIVSNANDFSAADVGKHIVYQTSTGYESGRFIITSYNVASGGTTVGVTVLQAPLQGTPQVPLYTWSAWRKSFTIVSGLSQYNGQTVGVVTDAGFLDKFTVTGGTITLPDETIFVTIGYQYTGIVKSMSLGFVFQGLNTQPLLKEINRMSARLVNSLGVKCGSSLYALEEVQLRTPADINYLPPVPVDCTHDVDYVDDSEQDKFFYIVQDKPLPASVASFMVRPNTRAIM